MLEELKSYLDKVRLIQYSILQYIDEVHNVEEKWTNLIQLINSYKIKDDYHEIETILRLINKICKNHRHTYDFFGKIEKIILIFKDEIKLNFSNITIFRFFKSNKRIIFFLNEQGIITIDKYISEIIMQYNYEKLKYPIYFFKEIRPFINEEEQNKILKEYNEYNDDFDMKRKIGENDDYICQLIRQDNIDEFISYIAKNDISINSKIKNSIFETNRYFLKQNYISLIKYSTFFGSIQITKYLKSNGVELQSYLWLYSVHSNDQETIDYLYDNKIEIKYININDIYKESIKCHHNDIINHINYLYYTNENTQDDFNSYALNYYNFSFIDFKSFDKTNFFIMCKYSHYMFVNILLKYNKIDINETYIYI